MSPTLEDQERHLLVKVIDRILYKLDDLVRPYVHKVGQCVCESGSTLTLFQYVSCAEIGTVCGSLTDSLFPRSWW